jgi:hypothetical protein
MFDDGFVFLTSSGKRLSYEAVLRRLRVWSRHVFGRAYSFHCLRHTAAVRVYEATRDVLVVQRFLGHKSLQWTDVYLRSLLAVEVNGLPGFCGGPTLAVRGEAFVNPRSEANNSRNATAGAHLRLVFSGSDDYEAEVCSPGPSALRPVCSPGPSALAPGIESGFSPREPVVTGIEIHDCVEWGGRHFDAVRGVWVVACRKCGRFVGILADVVKGNQRVFPLVNQREFPVMDKS